MFNGQQWHLLYLVSENTNMNSIEELLKEVKDISQRYDEIAKIAGDNYNVFEVLNIRSDEDSHSRILTNILDPKGIHNCGDIFLKLFFEKFLPDKSNIDFSNCQVYREYYARELGRPDICIFCNDFGIVIENKIDALDQEKQLSRYDELLKKKYGEKKYRLFYLTKDGREASKESHCNVEYMRLAYYKDPDVIEIENDSNSDNENSNIIKNDILSWIKCCQEKVFNKPLIRETLEQYINLFKKTRRDKMSEDVVKVLAKDAENIKATFEIAENTPKLQEHLIFEYLVKPLKEWEITKQRNLQIETENVSKSYFKVIIVRKDDWEDKNFCICFEFGGPIGEFKKLYYGLKTATDKDKIDENSDIVKKLGGHSEDYWYSEKFPFINEYKDWNGTKFAELLKTNNAIVGSFKNKIEELLTFIEKYELAKCARGK